MSENVSPVVETSVSVPNEVLESGQTEEQKKSEIAAESDPTEEVSETQNTDTTSDEGSKDEDPESEEDKKWIGRRLERAKAHEREKAAAEIEYWKKAAMATQGTQPQNPVQVQQQVVASVPKPVLADYKDIESFTEAVADWKIEQKLAQVQLKTQEQKSVETYQSRATEFAKVVKDFEPVINEFMKDYANVDIPELKTIAFESEAGPQIVYHLAKNVADMERILELPSHRRIMELGKIEEKLKGSKTAPVAKKVAPAPIKPEKGGAAVKKDLTDPNLSQKEYRALRLQQRKGRV